jgi:hypothetical protein
MTAKRTASPRRPTKTAARRPELTPEAVVSILEARPVGASVPTVDAEFRRQLIAAEAYFLAERRGFTAGHELDDWIAAEVAVDARLRESRVA